jgi:hypothetical protein
MKKADNFDASKWLVENKITTQSKLNEGIVTAPLSNFLWKLNPKVKEWENISSTKEALSFIKSLTNEELNNLYAWRLGFDIPQSEDEKIKNLLDLIDNKIGESKLNEDQSDSLLTLVKDYVDWTYTADQGYGTVNVDGKEMNRTKYAALQLEKIKPEIIKLKGEQYFEDVEEFASLSTVAEEYSGEDLTDELEAAALKLGFSLEDLT